MKDKTILVVDDERDIVELIEFHLHKEGYATLSAHDGPSAIESARRHHPDLIILDLMLPGCSGEQVTVTLRGAPDTRGIPIIMLTAKAEQSDEVIGLGLGADDYIVKPFSIRVLLARVEAVLRRAEPTGTAAERLVIGPLAIDRVRHHVEVAGRRVVLTLTEFRLLEALAAAQGRVLSRDQLMGHAMGAEALVTDRTIDVHITALRRKLGPHRGLIETVRGIGYRFTDQLG